MMRSLTILNVVPSLAPRYGGPPRIAESCSALASLGHHVELVSTTLDGPHDLHIPIGVPVERDGFVATAFAVPALRAWAFSPGLVRWLWANVRRFDVVHVHGVYGFTTLAATTICRARRVPYVVQPHGALTSYHRSYHRWRKSPYEWALERPAAQRALTVRWESARERDEGTAAGWPAGDIVPSGVWVPDLVSPQERRREEVVFLGRLSRKKGVDMLVDAFARVVAVRPEARLRVAGPDQDIRAADLAMQARELGISERVTFEGLVQSWGKVDLLRGAALVVVPSADESFGAVAVEAMAYGTPTVVTPGSPFHVELECAQAAVVSERDPEALAAAIVSVLADDALRRLLGRNGRAFVAARFDWNLVARQLERLYRKYLEGYPTLTPASRTLRAGRA